MGSEGVTSIRATPMGASVAGGEAAEGAYRRIENTKQGRRAKTEESAGKPDATPTPRDKHARVNKFALALECVRLADAFVRHITRGGLKIHGLKATHRAATVSSGRAMRSRMAGT